MHYNWLGYILQINWVMNIKKKIQENLLLKSTKISSKDQMESYYSKNKQKLPPILQSKHFFMEQLLQHEKSTNYTIESYKHKYSEYQPQKNSFVLRNKPQTYQSIQNLLKLNRTLITIQNSPKPKKEERTSSLIQKGENDQKKIIYLSSKKVNLQTICLSQKIQTKGVEAGETKYKKGTDYNISSKNSSQHLNQKDLHRLVMQNEAELLSQARSVEKTEKLQNSNSLQHSISRKHLRTCVFGQQMKFNTSEKNFSKGILKVRVHGPISQRVTSIIDQQSFQKSDKLATLDEKRQSLFSSEKFQPWSSTEQFQWDIAGNFRPI